MENSFSCVFSLINEKGFNYALNMWTLFPELPQQAFNTCSIEVNWSIYVEVICIVPKQACLKDELFQNKRI